MDGLQDTLLGLEGGGGPSAGPGLLAAWGWEGAAGPFGELSGASPAPSLSPAPSPASCASSPGPAAGGPCGHGGPGAGSVDGRRGAGALAGADYGALGLQPAGPRAPRGPRGARARMSAQRRRKASEREKLRMRTLADALHTLRTYLPPGCGRRGQPLTKIQTLRCTIQYIGELTALLRGAQSA